MTADVVRLPRVRDWLIFNKTVTHVKSGVAVRFYGPQGAYSGHQPADPSIKLDGARWRVPRDVPLDGDNPYHTRNWTELQAIVEEARRIFEGRFS